MQPSASRAHPLTIALVVATLLGATGAHAGRIEPTGVGRHAIRVLGGAMDGSLVEQEQAIDELTVPPFDDDGAVSITNGDAFASGYGSLFSFVDETRVVARGSALGMARAVGEARATARADTLFRFEFTVDEATPFELVVDLSTVGGSPFTSVIFSEDALGTRFERQLPGTGRDTLRGVLEPGAFYAFSANAVIGAFAGHAGPRTTISEGATFSVRLTLPEPASGIGLTAACLGFALRRRRASAA